LQKNIRDYDDKVLKGVIPPFEKGGKSPGSSTEASKSKRPKIEDDTELKFIKLEVDVLPRKRPPPKPVITSAYTHSAREEANIKQ
jgi:hypothetical protein